MNRGRFGGWRPGWILQTVTAIMLLPGLGRGQGSVAVTGGDNSRQSGIEGSEVVPFTLSDGYLIVVEGRIGTHRHLKLLLDTGATHSVLRSDLAEPTFARRPVRTVNLEQVLTQELVEVPDFELGPLRRSVLPMLLHDLAYLREIAPGIDGVVGLDLLRSRSFGIDFSRKRITFAPSPTLRHSARMELDEACLTVEVRMLNRPVRLLLDTGVRAILLYGDRLGDRLPELKVEQQIVGSSLGGVAALEVVTLPRIQLNGTDLNRRAVLLQRSPAGLLPQVDGYLALAAIGARRFNFDFESSTFSWE
jgi:hypothetical protein